MGSLIPFQDLNLLPDPPLTNTNTTRPTLLTPKIEPKLEPLDEPLENHQPHQLLLQLQHQQQQQQQQQQQEQQQQLYFSNTENTPLSTSQPSPDESDNVYSEFYRISELFRTAFAKGLQRYGDVDVLVDPDSRAIVPVPQEATTPTATTTTTNSNTNTNQVSTTTLTVSRRRPHHQRSSELVRVTDLGMEDQRYFYDVVRRTRMIYDSL